MILNLAHYHSHSTYKWISILGENWESDPVFDITSINEGPSALSTFLHPFFFFFPTAQATLK